MSQLTKAKEELSASHVDVERLKSQLANGPPPTSHSSPVKEV